MTRHLNVAVTDIPGPPKYRSFVGPNGFLPPFSNRESTSFNYRDDPEEKTHRQDGDAPSKSD
ncbi:uncharacterized protein BT62DRAFT_1008639 [Guyanagaster necrorhizus]|uniref:Uncharacterized protein n=1 Tax=Guyanagaster necrorhizus TaxID=856835 RepID=A0A9P7VP81_9AGAR|nr:uncharacterized protein BT62DRAFT_1008639 [Guyanagaster necrorhizus MCA 3950]KAG7443955.1 hypothetical protein BT62DRAFT_1008639 [Guyanagaster necrorhizus MCA 3950]